MANKLNQQQKQKEAARQKMIDASNALIRSRIIEDIRDLKRSRSIDSFVVYLILALIVLTTGFVYFELLVESSVCLVILSVLGILSAGSNHNTLYIKVFLTTLLCSIVYLITLLIIN